MKTRTEYLEANNLSRMNPGRVRGLVEPLGMTEEEGPDRSGSNT